MSQSHLKQVSPGSSLAIGLAFGGIFELVGAYIGQIRGIRVRGPAGDEADKRRTG